MLEGKGYEAVVLSAIGDFVAEIPLASLLLTKDEEVLCFLYVIW